MRWAVAGALSATLVLTVACTSSHPGAPAVSASPPAVSTSTPASASAASPGPAATGVTPAYPDWPTYHGDAARDGVSTAMPAATGTPRIASALKLDAAVYASPIIVGGVVVVATENDSVYGFDPAGHQLWKTSLGTPSPAGQRPCGDIDPLGITGTPVYDPASTSVYAVAELGGTIRHELVALDPTTGTVKWRRAIDLPGADPTVMQQRGALTITGGRVWVPFGALAGDCGNYVGRLIGVELDGTGAPVSYSTPTKRGGGMWNAAGATVDTNGRLLTVSANGAGFPGDPYDHANSVLELDEQAKLVDSFAPTDWAQNNQGDVGLGSQGVALVGTQWAVLGGKSGPVYVLRRGALGGIGGQVSVKNICKSFGGAAVQGDVIYLPCTDGVRAVRVDGSGQLHVLWHADRAITGSPVIGGGRIWALAPPDGVLHALDPATGKSVAEVAVGSASRFATPALYGPDVLVPTLAGVVIVATS